MAQFKEGDEVETWNGFDTLGAANQPGEPVWRKAVIIGMALIIGRRGEKYVVKFDDMSTAVSGANRIRPIQS